MMRTSFGRRGRLLFLTGAIVACFGAVFFKLWWLHVYKAPYFQEKIVEQRRYYRVDAARRGQIVDVQGEVLADALEVWDIGVDPKHLETLMIEQRKKKGVQGEDGIDKNALAKKVALILEIDEKEVRKAFDSIERRWVTLSKEQNEQTKKRIDELKVDAIYGSRKFLRTYPKGQLAAHIVGFVNKEEVPAMGIEKVMDKFLTGQDGFTESQKDGKKREIETRRERKVERIDGQKVELTIDSGFQKICEDQLKKIEEKFSPEAATIIISEPSSGKLLALANYPTFDLNEFFNPEVAPPKSQKNRAVTDVYEPGSVFKIVSISMGLNEGVVTPDTRFDCAPSTVPYRGKMLRLPKDDHPLGNATVSDIVAKSSNHGSVLVAMLVAEKFGEQKIYDYAYNFGFGRATGIITGTESVGILHKPEKWDGLTITRFPMGHAISVTPLQMHYAMATIANRGQLMEPQVISRVINPDGIESIVYPSKVRSTPIKPETAATMASLLRRVCMKGGTAAKADIPGFEVAGKTGTTQKLVNGNYSSKNHVASFSGFFPASNPKYVITVIIDDGHREGGGTAYGGTLCVPSFREIAEEIIRRTDMKPVSSRENIVSNR